ncbi:MAG: hypothetical protein ACTSPY_05515 [Candidatus Helarchaeota archaeon]
MRFSGYRYFLVGVLVFGAVIVPTLFHTQVIPMIQITTLSRQVVQIEGTGENQTITLLLNRTIRWIQSVTYNEEESNPEKAVFDIIVSLPNNVTGIEGYPMAFPGIDISLYYKAGYPYEIEKQAVMTWRSLPMDYIANTTYFPEPGDPIDIAYDIYDGVVDGIYFPYEVERWVKIITIESSETVIQYGSSGTPINIRITLHGGPNTGMDPEPHALSQFIGTMLRNLVSGRPLRDGVLYLKGSASISGFSMPFELGIPNILPSSLDLTSIINTFLNPSNQTGTNESSGLESLMGGVNIALNFSEIVEQVGIYDIQNYNDSNHNFQRDYNGYTTEGLKNWTEPLFENGAFSLSLLIKLAQRFGIQNLGIELPKSSCNLDDSNSTLIWNPPGKLDEDLLNELFFYIPKEAADYLNQPNWSNRVFGMLGFANDLALTADDISNGEIISGGTFRLLSDIRDPNFKISDAIASFIQGFTEGMIGMGMFGSIDLKLGDFPLSLLLNVPLTLPVSMDMLTSMGGSGEDSGLGDILGGFMSDPLNAFGLDGISFNGLALDTYQGLAQINSSIDMDLSFPFGLYLPTEILRDESGNLKPYLGVGGGPIGIYVNPKPSNWANMTLTQQEEWKNDNLLLELPSLDDPYLQESLANIIKDIAQTGEGQGIAYHFDDGIVDPTNPAEYGNLSNYYNTKNKLPPPASTKSDFKVTMDQMLFNLSSLIPVFGQGFFDFLESTGFDPLFIEYINNSVPGGLFNNLDLLLEMNVTRYLDMLYQPGPANDLIDYLIDANATYTLEPVTVLNATYDHGFYISVKLAHTGLKEVHALYDETQSINYWDAADVIANNITNPGTDGPWEDRLVINANGTTTGGVYSIYDGMVTINCTGLNQSLLPKIGDTLLINYTSSKLDLFSISNLLDTLLGGGGLSFGSDTESSMNIINDIPNVFASMGIDLNKILPEIIKYLRVNISDPVNGYGIKPFELMDIANIIASMGSNGGSGSDPLAGLSSTFQDTNMINALIESVVKKILSKIDPFGLMNELIGNPLPWLDYLNRSKLFTESFILPLVSGLFSGESNMFSEFPWDSVLNAIVPILAELLSGPGGTVIENHGALNLFSMLSIMETAEKMADEDVIFAPSWVPIYTNGEFNYTVDRPPYENLRLVSYLMNGLLNSGLDAEDLWTIIELLFGFGLFGEFGEQEEPSDGLEGLTSDVSNLIGLIGFLAPSGEWISVLRELGIFSRWEGEWEGLIDLYILIFGLRLGPFPIDLDALIGRLMNLEKFLATGTLEMLPDMGMDTMEFIRLCVIENQTYSNPWSYYAGYDSSANHGPYEEFIGVDSSDNWGWVPLSWDPGDPNADPPTYPQKGADYPKSFIQNVISALPLAIDIEIPEIDVQIDDVQLFGIIEMDISLLLPIDLPIRLRLQGNPWYLVKYLEETGMSLFGIATHFLGPTLKDLLLDILTPSGTTNTTGSSTDSLDEIMDKVLADPVALIKSVFDSGCDLMHAMKYFFDPTYMPASEWQVDSSYIDPGFVMGEENITGPTLYWDKIPTLGDNDEIPDEFPWYRFSIPRFNQDPNLVNAGPQTEASRNPALIDDLTPNGPPGSGKWLITPNGVPDGIEHYWYDTPFAYVNASVPLEDPTDPYYVWLSVDPINWNDPGFATNPITGADRLIELDDLYWDNAIAPYYALYYVPPGTELGNNSIRTGAGTAGRLPDPTLNYPVLEAPGSLYPTPDGYGYFPNIWWCFNDTLNQKDYRFGYWDTQYDDVLKKQVKFLNTKPFWDILSWGVSPHIIGAIDLIDLAALIEDLMVGSPTTSISKSPGDLLVGFGEDYYHILKYNELYKKYGIPQDYGLDPLAMLQWIWDGAGNYYNRTDSQQYTNIEPFTIPNIQGALQWLEDRGITLDFIINNLPSILDEFLSSGTPSSSDYGELLGTDTITGFIRGIESYFTNTVGENEFGNPNQTAGILVFMNIMRDFPEILDIYPMKIMRALINELLPTLDLTGMMDGSSSSTQSDPLELIKNTGLLDIIMLPKSQRPNFIMNLSILDSSLDFYLFGQKIDGIQLSNISLPIDQLLGGDSGSGTGNASASSELGLSSLMSKIPLEIPGGFPYLEISTFHGPFDILFNLRNLTDNAAYVPVVIGEVWYNETNNEYYLNRTQSDYEDQMNITGWFGDPAYDNLTYIRDELLVSDTSGNILYSSEIEKDLFGWLEPFIYIHVGDPVEERVSANGWSGDYYWWNLTTQSSQLTIAGNRPYMKARWITAGDNFILKKSNTFDSTILNIDNDNYAEIFAMIEIDNLSMGQQTVYYIPVGDITDPLQISSNINIYTDTTSDRDVNVSVVAPDKTNQFRYVYTQEYTPTQNMLSYPTISEVIKTIRIKSNNYWTDDSIVNCQIYYTNLTDSQILIYNYSLPKSTVNPFVADHYNGQNSEWLWSPNFENSHYLVFNYTQAYPGSTFRISELDIDTTNFGGWTIQPSSIFKAAPFTIDSVNLRYNLTYNPSWISNPTWQTRTLYNNSYARTSSRPIWFHQSSHNPPLIIKGYYSNGTEVELSKGSTPGAGASYAWFNYTYSISPFEYIYRIDWHVINKDNVTANNIERIMITYYNDTDGQWNKLMDLGPALWDENQGSLTDFDATGHSYVALDGGTNDLGQPNVQFWNLFLSNRAKLKAVGSLENISQVKFAVKLNDIIGDLGYQNGTRSYNVSAMVQFWAKEWDNSWGIETGAKEIELPEGFISNYLIEIKMYDPLAYYPEVPGQNSNWDSRFGRIFQINLNDRPEVNISHSLYGPIEDGSSIFPIFLNFTNLYFAKSVLLRIESWDSLVKSNAMLGDIWYKDNYQIEGSPQEVDNIPTINASIVYIDLEGNINLNVTIRPDIYLREFFLNMTQDYALGYLDRISISTDTNDTDSRILARLGKFPIRHTIGWNTNVTPWLSKTLKIGQVDLLGYNQSYIIMYYISFLLTPQYVIDAITMHRSETIYFRFIWTTKEGTYEVRPTSGPEKGTASTSDVSVNVALY